jgi:hypothetical protein
MTKTEHANRILNAFIAGTITYRDAFERLQHFCAQDQARRVLTTLSTYTL